MSVSLVLFTSDLRVHDHPALRAAVSSADEVVPLFIDDDGVREAGFAAPNRLAFLADCLADLDAALRERGGRLVLRRGHAVEEVCRAARESGAREVHMSAGVSGYARRREERLGAALGEAGVALRVHDASVTVVPPGEVTPSGRDHFAVFTPYFRRWAGLTPRDVLGAPRSVRVPSGPRSLALPRRRRVAGVSPGLETGGERAGRARLAAWCRDGIERYADLHDDLAVDGTSRLSPHLHFGTVSAVEVLHRARRREGPGPEAFVRQLAWRDFHHQVLAARPEASHEDYRGHADRWRAGASAREQAEAWRTGTTGFPLVDAAMRQLRHEGWMHNRARLLVASFLTKTLYVDWRVGARHFLDLLVDGDVANNQLNWQWAAGTGTDTRPNRVLNPLTQARRFDPEGRYVHRWVPELRGVRRPAVHQPWRLDERERADLGYPAPVVDLEAGRDRFLRARDN
ncbi:cryptochrome/photolyase family protein [Streptomyces sp. NPDC050560]|uniref:cryptochrome/photolyase family protein n=1 Tax=Streptomyces sp. NPDC050560 TaxID=3365630 RepID=UPI00379CB13F